jgi:hypothetical protein
MTNIHPAAVRAAEKWYESVGDVCDESSDLPEVIHSAIEEHLREYECPDCVDWHRKYAGRVRQAQEIARLERKLDVTELVEAAEAASKLPSVGNLYRLAQALANVKRGESDG